MCPASGEEDVLEQAGFHVSSERTNLPLDEIVGGAGIKNWIPLITWAKNFKVEEDEDSLKWVLDNIKILTDGKYAEDKLKPKKVMYPESYFKQRWYMKESESTTALTREDIYGKQAEAAQGDGTLKSPGGLLNWNVIRRAQHNEEIISRVVLFKTPKTPDPVSRLITCCQEPNANCEKTETFTMPHCEDIINMVRELGRAYYVVCDEKNAFFQQKIPKEWGRTMAINFEDELFFMNVLAQGHSWSAKINHQLCWARLVLMRADKEAPTLGVREQDIKSGCPVILKLYDAEGKMTGFIVVYIDNVLVAVKHLAMAHRWKKRIENNAKRMQEVVLKKGQASLYVDGDVEFIGVEYKWLEDIKEIGWRWAEKKQAQWIEANSGPLRAILWSPRLITSWVGTIMYTTRIGLNKLYVIKGKIDLANKAQKLADKHKNDLHWDTVLRHDEIEEEMWKTLEEIREALIAETMHIQPLREKKRPTIFAAVEASTGQGRGMVFLDHQGKVLHTVWIRNSNDEAAKCAFYLEILVILEAIDRANPPDRERKL